MALTFAACGEGNDKNELVWPGSTDNGTTNNGGNSGGNSNSGGTSNGDASAPELCVTLADAFAKLAENGKELAEMGLSYQANHEYGRALAAISAMRLCADELLAVKGETAPDDGRLTDWDAIGALNFAEWSVWIFEGIALKVKGDEDAAQTCFVNGAVNPEFNESYVNLFIPIAALSVAELKTLRQTLAEYEDKIYAEFAPEPILFQRDVYTYSAEYLIEKGFEALDANNENYAAALDCFLAAIRVDPNNADAFAAAATVCLYTEDLEATAHYIDEGLFLAPEHKGLLTLLNAYNGGL
jgi:tetratricopeptide (TPR) repeat protein